MISRSLFIAVLLGILLMACPPPSESAGRVIAAMMSSDQSRYREAHRAFIKSLAARGHVPAGTEIILQAPNPDPLSWTNTIRKFNAYKTDMIVAYGTSAALAAMKEADGIPVVSVDVYSSETPSRPMCGVSSRVPMVTLLKTLYDIRQYRRVGVLFNAREAGSNRQAEDVRRFAGQYGITVVAENVASTGALDTAITSMLDKVDAILVTESGVASRQFDKIISRTKGRGIPVISTMPDAADKGALVSLEINPQEQGFLGAEIASRILEGAKPESLGLLSPKRIDLVINMRTAREMGITVPFPVLGVATRILK